MARLRRTIGGDLSGVAIAPQNPQRRTTRPAKIVVTANDDLEVSFGKETSVRWE